MACISCAYLEQTLRKQHAPEVPHDLVVGPELLPNLEIEHVRHEDLYLLSVKNGKLRKQCATRAAANTG
jgi:hypothetical protein